ncbi:hypothetical protein WJX84_009005 [Apatococcus fuscideae]|uniref:Uncharacterized protein n=1 Tax=Apatococcus fuscideae TaxID=2026836 RepID=A0AAW1SPL1_9CHLO
MPPKAQATPPPDAPKVPKLEKLLPLWVEAHAVPEPLKGAFEDPDGLAAPTRLQPIIAKWLRPAELSAAQKVPEIPLFSSEASVIGPQVSVPGTPATPNRNVAGKLKLGHQDFYWIAAALSTIESWSTRIANGKFLWELVYPQDKNGLPCKSPSGKYHIKTNCVGNWRRLIVDDRIPVDSNGRILIPNWDPPQLWPLLLGKALLKLASWFHVLDDSDTSRIPAVRLLTGWPNIKLLDPSTNVPFRGGAMFRRLEGVLAGALEAQGDTFRMVTVSLPSSGDPVADIQDEAAVAAEVAAHSGTAAVFGIFDADRTVVVEKLKAQYPDRFKVAVQHMARKAGKGEVEGTDGYFVTKEVFQVMVAEGKFAEHREAAGGILMGTTYHSIHLVNEAGKCAVLEVRNLEQVSVMKAPALVRMAIIPVTREALERAVRLASPPKEKEPEIQKRIDATVPIVAEVQAKARSVFGGRFVQLVIDNEDVDTSMLDVRYGLGRHMPMLAGGLPEPLFVVGPYGAACGKTELIQRLMRDCPDIFAQPVPRTTRRGNRKALADGPFQVIDKTESESLKAHGGWLVQQTVMGELYGITKASIISIQLEGKVPLVDLDTVEDAQAVFNSGLGGHRVFIAPETTRSMKFRLEEAVALRPPPGYSPAEAVQGFCNAAQAEVDAANAAPELWKAQLTDGGLSGQHAAFYRLLDKVNEWYPARVPLEQVWGIGRPLWDPLSRVHGRQPLRLLVISPSTKGCQALCQTLAATYNLPRLRLDEYVMPLPKAPGQEADGPRRGASRMGSLLGGTLDSRGSLSSRGSIQAGERPSISRPAQGSISMAARGPQGSISMAQRGPQGSISIAQRGPQGSILNAGNLDSRGSLRAMGSISGAADGKPRETWGSMTIEQLPGLEDILAEHIKVERHPFLQRWLESGDVVQRGWLLEACPRDLAGELLVSELEEEADKVFFLDTKLSGDWDGAPPLSRVWAASQSAWQACRRLQGVFTDVSVDLDCDGIESKEVVKQAEEFITIESRLRSELQLADPAQFSGGLFTVQKTGKFRRQQIVYLKDLIGTERWWMPLGDLAELATSILEHQNPHAYQIEQQVEYLNGAAAPATLHLLAYESKHPCEFLITLSAAPPAANELPEHEVPMCQLDVERYTWRPKVDEASAVLKEADEASSFEGSGSDNGSGSEAGDEAGQEEADGEEKPEEAAEAAAAADTQPKEGEPAKAEEEKHVEEQHEEGSVLMSLKCKAGATDRLRLGRGRHLLKLRTPNDLLYNVTIRANAKFMAGGGAAVLKQWQGYNTWAINGVMPKSKAGVWRPLFRHRLMPQAHGAGCWVSADLAVPIPGVRTTTTLALVNNDNGKETRFGHCKMPATILPPSERGYNILAFPDKGAPGLDMEAPYRLVCVVDGPVDCSERSVARMETLHGEYTANRRLVVCSYQVTIGQAMQMAMRADMHPTEHTHLEVLRVPPEGLTWDQYETAEVVHHKHGACHGMTAYAFLLPGSYILQMRIDLNHCHHLIDESGQMDRDYTWNINVLPSVIEPLSAFIIIPDNAKAKYMQGLAAQWSSATKDRAKKAKEAITGLQAKLPMTAATRTIKGRAPLVLDPSSCIRVHQKPPTPEEPAPLARGISEIFASLSFLSADHEPTGTTLQTADRAEGELLAA